MGKIGRGLIKSVILAKARIHGISQNAIFLLFAWMLACASMTAEAKDLPVNGWQRGIAMQGAPKLSGDHFHYADPNARQGGTIVQGEVGTFDTLNPYTLKGTAISTPDLVFDRLTVRSWDEPFTLYGLIAKDIWLSPDRKRIIFALDPSAKFNNGEAITTDDIAATYEILRTKGRPNMRRVYNLVQSVDRYDDAHIGFTFTDGADRETPMILSMMPVLSAKDLASREFDKTTLKPLVSSGPYTLQKAEPGRSLTFVKTPNYWAKDHYTRKGLFNPERWVVKYFRDGGVALEAFKKGDLNFRVEKDPAKWAQQYEPRGFVKKNIKHHRPDRVRAIVFNTRKKPMDDMRVREALRLAFDQNWVLKAQGYGLLKPTNSLFPNTDLARSAKADKTATRDALLQADKLLTEAGYKVVNGKRNITLTLILNEARDEKIALAWKAALKRLGITLAIKTLDNVQFVGSLAQFDYDLVLHGWYNSLSPGSEQTVYWGCESAKTPGSLNYAGICDKDVDGLLKQIVQVKDRKELQSVTKKLDQRLWDLAPAIYLPHMEADFLAYWPNKVDPGPQNALYGFVLESLAVTP